jgi:hypothetical protein
MSGGYDQHQKQATRLVCQRCKKPYDVTHGDTIREFICQWCKRLQRSCDVGGVPMEGGATGP